MRKLLFTAFFLALMSSCEIVSELWFPSDLQTLQMNSRGDIVFSKVLLDPTSFVGKVNQTLVFECRASSDFPIKKVTLDLSPLIGEKLILSENSSGVWATNLRIYPLSEGSFTVQLVLSNEKGRVVTNALSVKVENQSIIYVAPFGKDYYEGLKDFPIASVNTAISNAVKKDISTLYLAEGLYSNASASSVLGIDHRTNLNLIGGWKSDFSTRDPSLFPTTFFGGGSKDQALGQINASAGIVLDGLNFVGSTNNSTDGGGLKIFSSEVTFINGVIASNETANNGGGIYAENSALTISNVDLFRNHSAVRGGAVYLRQVTGLFHDVGVKTNSAANGGGIAILESSSDLILREMRFFSNRSYPYDGGALWLRQSQCVITQNTFLNNTGYYGGAVFLELSSTPLITESIFSNNVAQGNGGAVFLQTQSYAKINQNSFYANYANNKYTIYENGNDTSPSEFENNSFKEITNLYRDDNGGGTIQNLSDLNALDENAYNPAGSVDGNTAL